jgi:hypothetical protein
MTELDIKQILTGEHSDYKIKNHKGLYVIKYNKSALNNENVTSLGLFRSVITDGEKILSFAPPKSINYNSFIVQNNFSECNITEFIDGTMINVFYNEKNMNENNEIEPKWELATRSNIGANCRFNLRSKKSFRDMFYEACVPTGEEVSDFFNKLNKEYSYSFVLQHPENRIVHKITQPRLYLTNIYKFEENIVQPVNYKNIHISMSEHIKHPRNITEIYPNISNWEYINLLCSGEQIGFELQGFIITNNKNERTKIRNIEYEKIKRMRGNNPKLQYQFLELYKQNKLNDYLYYFPENFNTIEEYKNSFYTWSEQLYNLYIDCFIERKIHLKDCPFEYKPLLYELHKHYIEVLRPSNNKVNFTFIKKYIKTIPTEKIMFSMNYKYRELKNKNNLDNHIQTQLNKQTTEFR